MLVAASRRTAQDARSILGCYPASQRPDHRHGAGFCRLRALIRPHQATVQRLDDRLELAHAARRRFEGIPRSGRWRWISATRHARRTRRPGRSRMSSTASRVGRIPTRRSTSGSTPRRDADRSQRRLPRPRAEAWATDLGARIRCAAAEADWRHRGAATPRRATASRVESEPWLNQKLRPSLRRAS
jgi:hypothetical protein